MKITFASIAFELKFSSAQINSVYAALELQHISTSTKMSIDELERHTDQLPQDFSRWILKRADMEISIVFEPRATYGHHNEELMDWGLIDY